MQTVACLLSSWNPDFTELRCSSLLVGWGSPALNPWSREESLGLPSAFLSSLLYLPSLAEKQHFSQRRSLQRAGWAAASCHLKSTFSSQSRDGHGQGAVVPEGSLGMLEPDASSSRQLVQAHCWAFHLGFFRNSDAEVVFCWQTQPWFTFVLGGLDGEEGISAVTNVAGVEEFQRKTKQLFFCIRRNWCQE